MQARKEPDGRWLVGLERGEPLRASIEGLALRENIQGARVWAIGALQDPEIGSYDLPTKMYHKHVFEGIWELLSLDGNLSMYQGKPLLHVHTAISGHDFAVKGGHLFDARVGVAVEMFIDPLDQALPRTFCEDIGLPRWEPQA